MGRDDSGMFCMKVAHAMGDSLARPVIKHQQIHHAHSIGPLTAAMPVRSVICYVVDSGYMRAPHSSSL